jgi:hypothetical protein
MQSSESRRGRTSAILCAAGTAVAGASTALGHEGWLPFLLWTASILLVFRCFGGSRDSSRPAEGSPYDSDAQLGRAFDWVALGLITLVAVVFRLYRIEDVPYGLWVDEIWTAGNSEALLTEQPFSPFGSMPLNPASPDGDRQSNLYLYFAGLVQWAFGYSWLGVKMISVLPGVLAPPALYLLARSWLSRPAALAAGGLLAVSVWHVTLSRWGWAEVLATSLLIPAFGLAARGLRQEADRPLLVSGLLCGISLHTYLAARIGLLAIACFLLARGLFSRGTASLRHLGVFVVGAAVAAAPLVGIWLREPGYFLQRIGEVSIVPQLLSLDLQPLVHNIVVHLLMFNWSGDMNPRHNIPGDPMLGPISGLLFLAGVLISLRYWRRMESQLCLIWLSIGLLAGIFTDPAEAPQAYRTGLVAPACFLLVAVAVEAALGRWQAAGGRRFLFATCLVLLLVTLCASLNARKYFHVRPASNVMWFASSGGVWRFVRGEIEARAELGAEIHVDDGNRNFILEFELRKLFQESSQPTAGAPRRDVDWVAVAGANADLSFMRVSDRPQALFVHPSHFGVVRRHLPGLRYRFLRNPFGRTMTVLFTNREHLLHPRACIAGDRRPRCAKTQPNPNASRSGILDAVMMVVLGPPPTARLT